MGVYTLRSGAGKLVGVRAARWVGGELYQAYYYFRQYNVASMAAARRTARDEAQALDRAWAGEQRRLRRSGRPNLTDVPGIRAIFEVNRSTHQTTYTPKFKVAGSRNTQLYGSSFSIPKWGYRRAWEEAVRYYARSHRQHQWVHLRRLMPPPAQFEEVRCWMNQRGHNVPREAIPAPGE